MGQRESDGVVITEKFLRERQRLSDVWKDPVYWAQPWHLSDREGPVLHHPGEMCQEGQHHLQVKGVAGDGGPGTV